MVRFLDGFVCRIGWRLDEKEMALWERGMKIFRIFTAVIRDDKYGKTNFC